MIYGFLPPEGDQAWSFRLRRRSADNLHHFLIEPAGVQPEALDLFGLIWNVTGWAPYGCTGFHMTL